MMWKTRIFHVPLQWMTWIWKKTVPGIDFDIFIDCLFRNIVDLWFRILGSGSRHLLGTKGKVFESSTSGSSQQSQDAAVGALIRAFKSAQPLRRSSWLDLSVELDSKRGSAISPRGMAREYKKKASSGPFFPSKKTASDALEELQLYKKTRDLLHTQNEREDIL